VLPLHLYRQNWLSVDPRLSYVVLLPNRTGSGQGAYAMDLGVLHFEA
jgi:hypothetical protein